MLRKFSYELDTIKHADNCIYPFKSWCLFSETDDWESCAGFYWAADACYIITDDYESHVNFTDGTPNTSIGGTTGDARHQIWECCKYFFCGF